MGGNKKLSYLFATGLLLVAASLIPLTAIAGTGTFGSYIGIDNGGGNAWYGATQPGPTTVWNFDGADLGDFTTGDSVLISGGELLTWKSDGGDITGANLFYSVYADGSSAGSYNQVGINWTSNSAFNDAAGNNFVNGGDQKWSTMTSSPDLLSGLGAGDYNLAVYFVANTNEGDRYDSNSGNNFVASFSLSNPSPAVPEPASAMLLVAAVLPLALLRRRR